MATAGELPEYKQNFLEICIKKDVLKFGKFKLKSGRISPYFFNTALFHTGFLVRALAIAYAEALISQEPALDFTVLFGPAYKGIPLAVSAVEKLGELSPDRFADVSYSFNRKEAKNHGEGGTVVGATLRGQRVVIVDDVVTAGTAKREAVDIIRQAGGEVVGMVVALDRMEKMPASEGQDDEDGVPRESAIGALRRELGIPILSVLTLDDLVTGLRQSGRTDVAEQCEAYRAKYRASD